MQGWVIFYQEPFTSGTVVYSNYYFDFRRQGPKETMKSSVIKSVARESNSEYWNTKGQWWSLYLKKLRGFSPLANYTDRVIAAGQRS
jgi:hypothetical protein